MSQAEDHPLHEYRDWLLEEFRFSETTADQYVSAARSLCAFADGDEITLESYRRWLTHLVDDGYAPSTVNEYHTKAKRYLQYQGAGFDPSRAAGTLPDYDPDSLPDPLTREQVRKMREAAETPEEEALVVLLYHTGLRNSEIHDLRWDDVDEKSGDLTVRRRKKRGWARDGLPLFEDQLEVLRALREQREDDNPYIFPAREGAKGIGAREQIIASDGSCSNDTIARMVRDLADRAGIERHVWPHLFRHTRATHLLEDGRDLDYVNQWLDHESYETTLRYARLTGASLRDHEGADSSGVFDRSSDETGDS